MTGVKPWKLAEGDYMKGGEGGEWWIRPPGRVFGTISDKVHAITEHEDGTITVSPSILQDSTGPDDPGWHGYLERGVWRTC